MVTVTTFLRKKNSDVSGSISPVGVWSIATRPARLMVTNIGAKRKMIASEYLPLFALLGAYVDRLALDKGTRFAALGPIHIPMRYLRLSVSNM